MKILIATEIFPPTTGGPAAWLEQIVPKLKNRGHQLQVVTFGDCKRLSDLQVKVECVELKQNKLWRFYKYQQLVKKLARDIDLILALGNVVAGQAAVGAKRKYGCPVVLRVPGDFAWEKAMSQETDLVGLEEFYEQKYSPTIEWLKAKQAKLAQVVDGLVVNSTYQAKAVNKYWQVEGSKINIIRNIFNLPEKILDKNELKKRLGWDKKTILAVGRLIKLKGLIELIDIMKLWLRRNPNWQLVIVGDGPLQEKFQQLIKSENLTENIKLVGRVSRADLYNFYQAADALVLYSLYESSPNVVLEAMSFDLPVIVSQQGGSEELVRDYPRGQLVAWGDKSALLAALDKIPEYQRRAWLEADRRIFFVDYSLEKNASAWESLLKKLSK